MQAEILTLAAGAGVWSGGDVFCHLLLLSQQDRHHKGRNRSNGQAWYGMTVGSSSDLAGEHVHSRTCLPAMHALIEI